MSLENTASVSMPGDASSSADALGTGAIKARTRGKRGGAKNKKSAGAGNEDGAGEGESKLVVLPTAAAAAAQHEQASLSAPTVVGVDGRADLTEEHPVKRSKPKAEVTRSADGKLIRPRGKRGGSKNRKVVSTSDKQGDTRSAVSSALKRSLKGSSTSTAKTADVVASSHSLAIAQWHALEKELSQSTTTPERRQQILKQQKELGGLKAYQYASVFGANHLKAGETGKWCAEMLQQARGKEPLHLLDVGAIAGTAYLKYPWIRTTSIDLEPRSSAVIRSDFFEYAKPDLDREQAEEAWKMSQAEQEGDEDGMAERRRWRGKFDVVALSLVINFVGDLDQRGRMLLHAHHYLSPTGYLYLVLPNACLTNSRYLTHDRLSDILNSAGYDVVKQDDSKRLSRWLCRRKEVAEQSKGNKKKQHAGWDGKKWTKEEVLGGAKRNNFCIKLVGP